MNGLEKGVLLLASLLALTACGSPPVDKARSSSGSPAALPAFPAPSAATPEASTADADVVALRAAGASKDNAYKIGNADSMDSFYAEDAVLMPPTARIAVGHAAIRSFLKTDFGELEDGGYTSVIAGAPSIRVSGDLGLRTGTYSTKDKSGATVDTGKWLEVWSKNDGKWLISRDIWNSDTLPLTVDQPEDSDSR